jgi:hypothetical protein
MQRDELMTLYQRACRGLRQDPEEAEFEIWRFVLGDCEPNDVHVALKKWWAGENGKYLPKPCELKPLAEASARIRLKLEIPDFCRDSAIGFILKLVEGKMIRVRCECIECARAWEWHNKARNRG